MMFQDAASHRGITIALKVASFAAVCAPIPGVGAIPKLLLDIQDTLKKVKRNKDQCKALQELVNRYVGAFIRQENAVKNAKLTSARDEVYGVLTYVHNKAEVWASYGFWRSIYRRGEISAGLQNCSEKITEQLGFFKLEMGIGTAGLSADIDQKVDEVLECNVKHRQDFAEFKAAALAILARIELAQGARKPADIETSYREMDRGYEIFEQEGKRSDAELKLCGTPISRAAYNALALRVKEILDKLHEERKAYPVPDLGDRISRVVEVSGDEHGGYTELHKGVLDSGHEEIPRYVALKTVRGLEKESAAAKAAIRFEEEIRVWSQLRHQNIDTLLGISTGCTPYIALASPWYTNRSLIQYTTSHSHPNKLKLLKDAAAGMRYLHDSRCIHGKLKGSNILVTDNLDAVISDFQMARIAGQEGPSRTAPPDMRWTARELLRAERTVPTYASDIWAFGMVMVEIFTGVPPFHQIRSLSAVITGVADGRLPDRPQDTAWVTDKVWRLMQECWKENPAERPNFAEIHRRLECAEETHDKLIGFEKSSATIHDDLEPLDL